MRRLAARSLLVLFGLLLGILSVEIGIRLAGPNVPLDLTMARFQAYHPVYGFFHRPGVSGWLRTREFTSYVKFNTQGLRGPEVAVPKPSGTFRVLVLGDSVVEGAQVAQEDTLAARLGPRLAEMGVPGRVESINAGVAGFGTGQQLLYLEQEGAAFQPDLVVLVFTIANDVADNGIEVARRWKLAAERRPFFVIESDGALRQLPFDAPPPEPLAGLRSFLRDRSVLFNVVELWATGKGVARAQGSVVPPEDAEKEVYRREPGDDWPQAWEVTERLLQELDSAAARIGAPLVVVLAPTEWQTYEEWWSEFMGTGSQVERRFGPNVPNERLAEIAARSGLRLVDLLPTFRQEAHAGGPLLFFRRDGHWTEHGHAVATRVVADSIAERRLVPISRTTAGP
jgi:hypothetical protein